MPRAIKIQVCGFIHIPLQQGWDYKKLYNDVIPEKYEDVLSVVSNEDFPSDSIFNSGVLLIGNLPDEVGKETSKELSTDDLLVISGDIKYLKARFKKKYAEQVQYFKNTYGDANVFVGFGVLTYTY